MGDVELNKDSESDVESRTDLKLLCSVQLRPRCRWRPGAGLGCWQVGSRIHCFDGGEHYLSILQLGAFQLLAFRLETPAHQSTRIQ